MDSLYLEVVWGLAFIFWKYPWLLLVLFCIELWFAMPSPWHGIIMLICFWVGYLVLLPLAFMLLKR